MTTQKKISMATVGAIVSAAALFLASIIAIINTPPASSVEKTSINSSN